MKITAISLQVKNKNRVSVSVDGKYRFSLDVFQLSEMGLKTGQEYDEAGLVALVQESQFGKLYARTLEYCLMRPHSAKEVRDYLYRKTRDVRTQTGEIRKGATVQTTERVFSRLVEKSYIDDQHFTQYWVENRSLTKGVSRRKLTAELRSKGIAQTTIEQTWQGSERSENDELLKVIAKKKSRYPDAQKLISYLARQGFNYDDIKSTLAIQDDESVNSG